MTKKGEEAYRNGNQEKKTHLGLDIVCSLDGQLSSDSDCCMIGFSGAGQLILGHDAELEKQKNKWNILY